MRGVCDVGCLIDLGACGNHRLRVGVNGRHIRAHRDGCSPCACTGHRIRFHAVAIGRCHGQTTEGVSVTCSHPLLCECIKGVAATDGIAFGVGRLQARLADTALTRDGTAVADAVMACCGLQCIALPERLHIGVLANTGQSGLVKHYHTGCRTHSGAAAAGRAARDQIHRGATIGRHQRTTARPHGRAVVDACLRVGRERENRRRAGEPGRTADAKANARQAQGFLRICLHREVSTGLDPGVAADPGLRRLGQHAHIRCCAATNRTPSTRAHDNIKHIRVAGGRNIHTLLRQRRALVKLHAVTDIRLGLPVQHINDGRATHRNRTGSRRTDGEGFEVFRRGSRNAGHTVGTGLHTVAHKRTRLVLDGVYGRSHTHTNRAADGHAAHNVKHRQCVLRIKRQIAVGTQLRLGRVGYVGLRRVFCGQHVGHTRDSHVATGCATETDQVDVLQVLRTETDTARAVDIGTGANVAAGVVMA